MRRVRASVVLALVLAACGEGAATAPPGIFFPTAREEADAGMAALFQGTLVVRDDCVLARGGDDFMLPIWPKGFTAALDDAGRLEVRDDEDRVVAVEGAPFETGGGYVAEFQPPDKVEPRDEQIRRLEESLGAPIPDRCLGTDVYGAWLVFNIEPR